MSCVKVNIIQFIRAVEPREPIDLLLPVKKQLELLRAYDLKGTFLLQYDALIDPRYTDLLAEQDPRRVDVGLWLEVVQPQAQAAGLPWTGRYPWDWHAHCGFLLGYPPAQRERLIDEAFHAFRERFGRYPTAVGCWMIDTYSLCYIQQTYGIDAACICREQWGMDGYTLWGGYFNGGYYPSRLNVLCPAQTPEQQLPVPVFRLSGSDPVYDYDIDLDYPGIKKAFHLPLLSSEAGCKDGGASPRWLSWLTGVYGDEVTSPFGYMQLGQENSFGWEFMRPGIELQFQRAAALMRDGAADVETLTETGRWFQAAFPSTPACTLWAGDWRGENRASLWYQSPYYRVNAFYEAGRFWLRDVHFYHEHYRDRYLDTAEDSNAFCYDSLPFTEGRLWSRSRAVGGRDFRAGLYFYGKDGRPLTGSRPVARKIEEGVTRLDWASDAGAVELTMAPAALSVRFAEPGGYMENIWLAGGEEPVPFLSGDGRSITARHNRFPYRLILEAGAARLLEDRLLLLPDESGLLRLNGRCVREGG